DIQAQATGSNVLVSLVFVALLVPFFCFFVFFGNTYSRRYDTIPASPAASRSSPTVAAIQLLPTAIVQRDIDWQHGKVQLMATLDGQGSAVSALAFSPSGQVFASGGSDGILQIRRADDGAVIRSIQTHAGRLASVAFSPDGSLVATSSSAETIDLWRV